MPYTLPNDVGERPIAIDVAGTLGRRIASVYAAAGTDVRIFDLCADQRKAAGDYVAEQVDEVRHVLGLSSDRTGEVELPDDVGEAVRGAWMVIEAVPEKVELKREVFEALDQLAERDAILASNSSSLPTSQMIEPGGTPGAGAEHPLPAAAGAELRRPDVVRKDR